MKKFLNELTTDFADFDFAHSYMESHSVSRLAAQIYALRKQRGWSQAELAEKAGIAQERVSKIESADFESLTMKTLHKFSRAFDVDLRVGFESFSEGIMDVVKLNAEKLRVDSREQDLSRFTFDVSRNGPSWIQSGSAPVTTAVNPPTVAPIVGMRVGTWNAVTSREVEA